MIKVQHPILIHRPLPDVFAFVANDANEPRWRAEVRSMRNTPPAPLGVGTQSVEIAHLLGRHPETTTGITAWEPDRRVVSETIAGQIPSVAARSFDPVDGGTAVTYQLEGDERGVVLFRLVRPLLQWWYQRKVEGYVETLKRLLAAPAR